MTTAPIPFGRVQPFAAGMGVIRLFGSMGATVDVYPAFTKQVAMKNVCEGCPRTWVVTLTGREIQRFSSETPLRALLLADFDNPPVGALSVPRTQLKFAISADLGFAGRRRFFVDAGQTFEVEASRICIDWLAPEIFLPVVDNQSSPPVTPLTGFVVDAMIGAEAAIVENAIGLTEATFTTHLAVAAGTAGNIIVPPYAQQVIVYQNPSGAASTQWVQAYGVAPVGPFDIGSLPFIPGERRTEQETLLPDATHLRTDIDPANARFFTMRWTIRP